MKNTITAALVGGVLTATALGFAGHAAADSGGTDEFLAQMHGTNPGTTRMTQVVVPGGDTELMSLGRQACADDAKGLIGRDVAAQLRTVEPNIRYARKDPALIVDDPAIFLQNAAFNYLCPNQ